MTDDSQSWPADLSKRMAADAQSRAADPSSFLIEILRHYWMDSTAEEARRLWRTTVRDRPAYATDILNCLYVISQSPPPDLVSLVERGGVSIFDEGSPTPYTREQYARWLSSVHDDWHRIFSSAHLAE